MSKPEMTKSEMTKSEMTKSEVTRSEEARTKSACGCGCAPESAGPDAAWNDPDELRTLVRERYTAWAEGKDPSGGCCGGTSASSSTSNMQAIGYTAEDSAAVPEGADLGLGCGNPLAYAGVAQGETVLDLGSGAGIDCFLAARAVGPSGRVIGVDMTPAMVTRARGNAAKVEAQNVEFRLGEIEHLPVADSSVDLIISNCVINLSPDKPQVFREAFRALKPGGRMLVSDLVLSRELPEAVRRNTALYVGCVAGASTREEYLREIAQAGFTKVEIVAENGFTCGEENFPAGSPEQRAFGAVSSLKVRAFKEPS